MLISSIKHAQHAKPGLHPTRSTLSVGLTAVLLPLCLASPALADGPASPAAGTATTSTVTTEPAAPSAAAETAPAADPEPVMQTTTLRISGPGGTVAPGSHTIAVRLLADDRAVQNGFIRLEKRTTGGWVYAGRLLTRANGLGVGTLHFTSTTRVRAIYQGAATRTAGESREMVVSVGSGSTARAGSSAAGFRSTAIRAATSKAGKPYRWGATGPNAFDCSGLVKYAFAKAGKSLPRTSGAMRQATSNVSRSAKKPGDLIFMSSNGRIGHVAIYVGGNLMVDSPRAGKNVSVRKIYSSQYLVGRVV